MLVKIMPRTCVVSQDIMTPDTEGYMCTSLFTFLPCRQKVTLGIFPMGWRVVLLTALGVISE